MGQCSKSILIKVFPCLKNVRCHLPVIELKYSCSVSSLKAAIERKTKTPAASLVLLVSGGEVLQSDHMVSSYSAGTDTNPIYMFSKPSVKESHLKQSSKYLFLFVSTYSKIDIPYSCDASILKIVNRSFKTYKTDC